MDFPQFKVLSKWTPYEGKKYRYIIFASGQPGIQIKTQEKQNYLIGLDQLGIQKTLSEMQWKSR